MQAQTSTINKSLTSTSKKLLANRVLFQAGNSLLEIFFNFFIWEKTKDFEKLLVYNICFFATIPIGSAISTIVSKKLKIKTDYIIAIIGYVLYALALSLYSDWAINNLTTLGLIFGTLVGLRALPQNVLFETVVKGENREHYKGLEFSFNKFLGLVLPLATSWFIAQTGNYYLVFGLAVIFFFISAVPLLRFKSNNEETVKHFKKTNFQYALKAFFSDKELRRANIARFLNAVRGGINWSLMGIISLYILGDLKSWGVFNTAIGLFSIFVAYTFGKKIDLRTSKFGAMSAALLFFTGSIIFASNFSFAYFLLFFLAKTVFDATYFTSTSGINTAINDQVDQIDQIRRELSTLSEIPLTLGRVLPLLILFITKTNLENDLYLRIIIAAIGIMPYLSFSVLGRSEVVEKVGTRFGEKVM